MVNIKRLSFLISFLFSFVSSAANPTFIISPIIRAPSIVYIGQIATASYLVTNNTPYQLNSNGMVNIPSGVKQIITNGACSNPFNLSPGASCTLQLQIHGDLMQSDIQGGPQICNTLNNPIYCAQPSPMDVLSVQKSSIVATLTQSVSQLALKTNGVPRNITITNNSTTTAFNVNYSSTSLLNITPVSCGNIAPNGTCILTITPGPTPSAAPGALNPTPILLTIKGDNTNTVISEINIVTYGSAYQSGFIFAIDDTTPPSGSIGGKVVALRDQITDPPGIIWSAQVNGTTAFDPIYGIGENSTPTMPQPNAGQVAGQSACEGKFDGRCNTNNIVVFYSLPNKNPPVPRTLYAAGLCKSTIDGFNDWYLPSICELGPELILCPPGTTPNIGENLAVLWNASCSGATCIRGSYWSSTESSTNYNFLAWFVDFSPLGFTTAIANKGSTISVRCIRFLIP
ncbi:TPA: DUF1566 domain-containing protein [Legionella pneumophila]|nr:DUF1566 domain-containing protein [Legionella pneumophila]